MTFRGNPRKAISAINTGGGIVCSRTSGQTPCFIQVSASAITATGSTLPYEDLEFRWDFGDPSGTEYFVSPVIGLRLNANYQYGPEASYCYRAAGTYTVTLRVRGLDANGAIVEETTTEEITVTAFSGTDYYFDSVAGNDANDGLSEGAPKQSRTAIIAAIASGRRINLKRWSSWSEILAIPNANIEGLRVRAYGVGQDPVFHVASGYALSLTGGGSSSPRDKNDFVFSNIRLMSDTRGSVFWSSANSTGDLTDLYLDNCFVSVGSGASEVNAVNFEVGSGIAERWGIWGGGVSGPLTPDLGNRQGIYGGIQSWMFLVGFKVEGGGSNVVLDHHIYPQTRYHSLYRWLEFGYGEGRNYCINTNYDQLGDSLEYAEYHAILECAFTGTLRAIDASNGLNDPTKTLFRNFVVSGCAMHGLPGDGVVLFYCCESMTVRNCTVWGCDGGRWFAPDQALDDILAANVYGNKVYRASGSGDIIAPGGAVTVAQQYTDNVFVDVRSTARLLSLVASDHESAGSMVDHNQYHAPNDSTPFYDNGTQKNLADWQAAGMDENSSMADPNWIDPANGVFDVPAGKVRMGLRVEA